MSPLSQLLALNDAQNALRPAGVQAQHIADLWHLTVTICTVVFASVLIAFFLALWRGTRQRAATPDVASLSRHEIGLVRGVVLGVLASAVLLFVLIVADFFTSRALANISTEDAVHIELTGRQWWWSARYTNPDPTKQFSTANDLHIPVGKTVIVELKSGDVIHSFWVPNLHGKKDLLPGQTAYIRFRADRAGTYRGQCAEFCGFEHALMALTVTAESNEQFEAWADAQRQNAPTPTDEKLKHGHDVFMNATCTQCHAIQGTTAGATFGPDLTHIASRSTLAAGTLPNDDVHLRDWIRDPQKFKPGANMPANPLPDADLDALVAYLRSLK